MCNVERISGVLKKASPFFVRSDCRKANHLSKKLRLFSMNAAVAAFKLNKTTQKECKHSSGLFHLSYASRCLRTDYLSVTLAPSASSLALASSAVALSAASLITLGAPSTASLASFSPRPVNSRTTLITLTLFGPTSVSSISNSVFSSAAAASPPAAATTTPAAADTPNSSSHAFTRSFNSNTLNSLIASINYAVVNFAIIFFLHMKYY